MSKARNARRAQARSAQSHCTVLAVLLGDFYEFLAKSPQPTNEEVKAAFNTANNKWTTYCKSHEMMNMSRLFIDNVHEAWKRHTVQ